MKEIGIMQNDAHHLDSNVRPAVGIGVMLRQDNRVLLGRRKGAHGAGTFGWPGGGLGFGESLLDAVRREAREESGVVVKSARLVCVSNVIEYGRHYLDLEFEVTDFEGEPTVVEPQFTETWNWYHIEDLPSPLFKPCQLALNSLQTRQVLNDPDEE
jgi:8-oxo-dGTP diphosphatase